MALDSEARNKHYVQLHKPARWSTGTFLDPAGTVFLTTSTPKLQFFYKSLQAVLCTKQLKKQSNCKYLKHFD